MGWFPFARTISSRLSRPRLGSGRIPLSGLSGPHIPKNSSAAHLLPRFTCPAAERGPPTTLVLFDVSPAAPRQVVVEQENHPFP